MSLFRGVVLLFVLFLIVTDLLTLCECDPLCLNEEKYSPSQSYSYIRSAFAKDHCYNCDWAKAKLTVVMLYHNECNTLRLLVNTWVSLPFDFRNQMRLLIVDDNSQIHACSCVDNLNVVDENRFSIVRISDSRPWNIGGARNMGAFYTCSEFLFFCDIDAYITKKLLENVLHLIDRSEAAVQLSQFNRFMSEDKTKFHPGMMLVSRRAYWEIHGCDEDFVGHYGQTDPHFRYNFALRFSIVQHHNIYMCVVKSSADDMFKELLPKLDRNTLPNEKLFRLKRKKIVNWNYTMLRFHWQEDRCDTQIKNLENQTRYPVVESELRKYLSKPLMPQDAFPLRYWAKNMQQRCQYDDVKNPTENNPCRNDGCS